MLRHTPDVLVKLESLRAHGRLTKTLGRKLIMLDTPEYTVKKYQFTRPFLLYKNLVYDS